MMSTRDEELRRLAQAATPGPWRVGTPPPNGEQTIGTLGGLMVAVATTGWGVNSKDNADFIAAANPATVIEMLDEIARQQAEIERLRAVFNAAKRVLHADKLPFSESRAQFESEMLLLELAVEDTTKAEQGGA